MKAEDLYIPYINVLLLTVAVAFALSLGISRVYSAFIYSNHVKEIDGSSVSFDKLDGLLSEYGSVIILMPLRDLGKYQVAKLGLEIGTPIQ